jgi:hypothetical protein
VGLHEGYVCILPRPVFMRKPLHPCAGNWVGRFPVSTPNSAQVKGWRVSVYALQHGGSPRGPRKLALIPRFGTQSETLARCGVVRQQIGTPLPRVTMHSFSCAEP